jgi:polysaccharide biosynthesis protein PslH
MALHTRFLDTVMARPTTDRPAALFVAPIMPSDSGNGLAMRAGFLLDAYAKRFAIDLAVVPVAGGIQTLTPFVKARTRRATVLSAGPLDTHFALVAGLSDPEARLAAFRQYGRPSITARLSAELERALLTFAGETCYRLVHASRLYLASLAATWMRGERRPSCLVLDCDEDDASAYRRLARLNRNWGRSALAAWVNAEADAFKALAAQWLPRFDLQLAASRSEARRLSAYADATGVTVVPNVVPTNASNCVVRHDCRGRRDILFVGNMSYLPNIDAALWFALRVWPRLRSDVRYPLRFVIAGPGAPREVRNLARRPGIVVAGGFEDVAPLYRRAALAVVPIRAGGGTRIKLLESAKYGVPVVATSFGAEGTGLRSGHELMLADNERDFAASCSRLLVDGKLSSRLAARALARVSRDFSATRSSEHLFAAIDARCCTGVKRE